MKKKETKVLCPTCGTEFATAEKEFTAVATVIGKDSGLGIVYPVVAGQKTQAKTPKLPVKAKDRIEALRAAGVDVSALFAMQSEDGDEYVAANRKGHVTILEDDDPIFSYILNQGTVPNPRLFRRWIMAQMFHMLTYRSHRNPYEEGVTAAIHNMGYEYQWRMLLNELSTQVKLADRDTENYTYRNRWFNKDVVVAMAQDYIKKLKKRVESTPDRKCKNIPYKRIAGRDIFISDLHYKLYSPLTLAMSHIRMATNPTQLYQAAARFSKLRIKLSHDTPQCKEWIDAYKGAGAFFTMQNLVRFHNCVAYDDNNKRLTKHQSLVFIDLKADAYKNGEGWRLLAAMKKMLDDNGINVRKKMAEWRKKK